MKKSTKKLVGAGVAVIAVISYLMFTGLSQSSVYYLEVTELVNDPTKYNTQSARLSGDVVQGSVIKSNDVTSKLLKFEVSDELGSKVKVEYMGVVPDAFYDPNAVVILEGKFDATTTTFHAKTLMAKCPSKYENEDPASHDPTQAMSESSSKEI